LATASHRAPPFDELFWRKSEHNDTLAAWNVPKDAARAIASTPASVAGAIQGFIVEFPVNWTWTENNQSGMNLTVLADLWDPKARDSAEQIAAAEANTQSPLPSIQSDFREIAAAAQ